MPKTLAVFVDSFYCDRTEQATIKLEKKISTERLGRLDFVQSQGLEQRMQKFQLERSLMQYFQVF